MEWLADSFLYHIAFKSSSGGGGHSHDVHTKSGLTSIYNQPVTRVEHVERPIRSTGGLITHEGVRSAVVVITLACMHDYFTYVLIMK